MPITFVDSPTSPAALFEFGQVDWLAARPTDATVQRILDDEGTQ